ncbi:unnamed protein product [Closterium sp. Naga37s-1]|nr:unnamed protein product [Closterium sp. Naga37s-1]
MHANVSPACSQTTVTSRRDVDASTRDAYTHLMHHAVLDIPLAAVNPVDLAFESTPLLIINGSLLPTAAPAASGGGAAAAGYGVSSTTPSHTSPAPATPPPSTPAATAAAPASPSTPLTPSTPPSESAGAGGGEGERSSSSARKAAAGTPYSPSVVASGGRSGGGGGGRRGSGGSLMDAAADAVMRLQHMLPAFLASSPPPPPPTRPLIAWHRFSPRLLASGPLDRLLLFDLHASALHSGPSLSPPPPSILLHELQRHVSCVDWRPKAGATLAVACRRSSSFISYLPPPLIPSFPSSVPPLLVPPLLVPRPPFPHSFYVPPSCSSITRLQPPPLYVPHLPRAPHHTPASPATQPPPSTCHHHCVLLSGRASACGTWQGLSWWRGHLGETQLYPASQGPAWEQWGEGGGDGE